MKTEGINLLLLTISAFWSSARWPLATKMSSRRQRSISLGGRYRHVHCKRGPRTSVTAMLEQGWKPTWIIVHNIHIALRLTLYQPTYCREVGVGKTRVSSNIVGSFLWSDNIYDVCYENARCPTLFGVAHMYSNRNGGIWYIYIYMKMTRIMEAYFIRC